MLIPSRLKSSPTVVIVADLISTVPCLKDFYQEILNVACVSWEYVFVFGTKQPKLATY